MSLKVTDSGPPKVQPSTCFKNLHLNSVASFTNNLKINFEQIGVNFFLNVDLFNNAVDCFFFRNICKQ